MLRIGVRSARAATIDALTALESVIRDASTAGAGELEHRLDSLLRKPGSPGFVSKWAVEIAIRLRQLVCAQVTGGISREIADDRYVRLVSDLEDERAVLVDEMRRGEHQ